MCIHSLSIRLCFPRVSTLAVDKILAVVVADIVRFSPFFWSYPSLEIEANVIFFVLVYSIIWMEIIHNKMLVDHFAILMHVLFNASYITYVFLCALDIDTNVNDFFSSLKSMLLIERFFCFHSFIIKNFAPAKFICFGSKLTILFIGQFCK